MAMRSPHPNRPGEYAAFGKERPRFLRRPMRQLLIRPRSSALRQPPIPANPKIGILGASRFKQNVAGVWASGNSGMYSFQQGWLEWARVLCSKPFQFPAWEDHSHYSNANTTNGFVFAQDGQVLQQMERRITKILASDVDVVIVNTNVGSVNGIGDGSVTAYCNYLKSVILRMYGKKYIILENLWERGVEAGGIWISGGQGRVQTPLINSTMASWCSGVLGIPVIDSRSVMINMADPDKNPISAYVRGPVDTTHASNLGGYYWAKGAVVPVLEAILPAAALPDPAAAGNFAPNGQMTGTGGTIGAGGSGTLPDSYTFARQGSTVTSALSIVNKVPNDTARYGSSAKNWLQVVLNGSSGLSAGVREGAVITCTATGLTIGNWYEMRALLEADVSDGTSGGCTVSISDTNGNFSTAMMPTNAGGANSGGLFSTGTTAVTQEAWTGEFVPHYFKATTTSVALNFRCASINGAGAPTFRITDFQCRAIADPGAHFAASTDPTFTSAASYSTPEEVAGFFQVTNAAPCQFGHQADVWSGTSGGYDSSTTGDHGNAILGNDKNFFTIDPWGKLTWNALDFEIPGDSDGNNIYTFTLTATPFDPTRAAITQDFTLTVTDVNDGFTDQFTYAEHSTDLTACTGSPWTLVGTLNAIRTNSTGGKATNNSAIATTYYFAPQQGSNTIEQQVTAKIADTSGKMSVMILQNAAATKWLRAIESGATWVVSDEVGTISTISATDMYQAKVAFDSFTFRVFGTNLYVYQNTVLVKTIDLTSRISGLNSNGCFFSGMRNSASGSGSMEAWNNRVAQGTYADGVGLRALTISPNTGTAGALYIGLLSNKTGGSGISLGAVKKNGVDSTEEWIADGTQIRGTAPTAGTWTIEVIESYPGAVNDGRLTTLTITIS